MKKLLLGLMLTISVIGLSACTGLTALSEEFVFASDEQVLSFSAISTATLLSDSVVVPLATVKQTTQQLGFGNSDLTIEQVEPYLELFENLLSQNNGLTVTTTASDLPEYETMNQFTVVDLLGTTTVYIMYYNTVLLTTEDTTEDDETETQYEINGILLIGSLEYQITGKKEIEDGEEKISFKSYIDENNYVYSQYKVEDDEKKFSVKIVENGIITSESKIKVELEDGETSISLEYTQGANKSNYKFKFETEDGVNILKIKYNSLIDGIEESGKIKVEVLIDELTNTTSYQLYVEPDDEDAYEHESDRNFKNDDEDDDQDEDDDMDQEDDLDEDDDLEDQTEDNTQDATAEATTGYSEAGTTQSI